MNREVSKVIINGPSLVLEPVSDANKETKTGIIIPNQRETMYSTGIVRNIGNDLMELPEVKSGDLKLGTYILYNRNRVTPIELDHDGDPKEFMMAEDYKAAVKVIL